MGEGIPEVMEIEEVSLEITCLLQQQGWESLGQRATKGGSEVGSYNHKALSYQWIPNVRHSFAEYAKQTNYKWLKICLFGLFLK